MLYDVCYNREVAEDAALYWTKDEGNLASVIDKADTLDAVAIEEYGNKAKKRIQDYYSWKLIGEMYLRIWKV